MVADFFAGELIVELGKELFKLCGRACRCKSSAQQLRSSLEQLQPIIHEIQHSGRELPQHRQRQLDDLVGKLRWGLEVVRRASTSSPWNLYKIIQLSRQLDKIEKSVSRFVSWHIPVHVLADVHHATVDSSVRSDRIESKLEEILSAVRLGEKRLLVDDHHVLNYVGQADEEEQMNINNDVMGYGMRVGVQKVRDMLIDETNSVGVVGIHGIGGSGKTTLAKLICKDPQIISYFENRIIFVSVSQSPNLEQLRQKIWELIPDNCLTSGRDYTPPWRIKFEQSIRKPTLVVLDDVWTISQLDQLVLKTPGCKTLVVSRSRFPAVVNSFYEVELLKEEEALSLFCSSAFGQKAILHNFDKKLVKQVAAECKGLPLALKVIGASLRGKPPKVWESAKNVLPRGEAINDCHEARFFERMAASIKRLPEKVKECFLDLGCFPEDQKIPLGVLISMWAEVHDIEEVDAFPILLELSEKYLLTIVKDAQNRAGDIYSSYHELSVTQHDVLRELALYMGNSENINRRARLIMPRREDRLPKEWLRKRDQPFDARIVSIQTGEMKEADWFDMDFPNAEVLMLNFCTSSKYFLPPFVEKMPKLKSLVLINSGSGSATLHNLAVFTTLYNLRSLCLEKVTVPPLCKNTVPLVELRKISLVLCEVSKGLNGSALSHSQIFPSLSELTIDHCIDLSELPSNVCGIQSLESLSITNCHNLKELHPELGRLSSLRILRVYGCPSLKKLPQALCGLKKLKYLDISQCMNLRSLPEGMGQMVSLEKLDMRECSGIQSLPMSIKLLRSLSQVVCDEGIAFLWEETEKALPELSIQVAEERYSLDWLL